MSVSRAVMSRPTTMRGMSRELMEPADLPGLEAWINGTMKLPR
jgi:hypothetical protein